MNDALVIGLSLILAISCFLGMCIWTFSSRNKQRYEDAGNIPFYKSDTDAKNNDEVTK